MIRYSRKRQDVEIRKGETILQHSIREKIPHLQECGGNGICTTCRVRIHSGSSQLSPLSKKEEEIKSIKDWDDSIRLACQAKVLGGPLTVERLIWSNNQPNHLQTENIAVGIGEEKDLTILICDMRDFTPLAEKQLNFDLAHILNLFYNALGDPIFLNNGIIYQYVGDEIIALFGVSGDNPEKSCEDAIRAALAMRHAVERLNRWELKEFDIHLDIGIGIHHGRAFVGNIGHDRYKQFAVIGDTVNVTSRIQGQNKELGTKLLASDFVISSIPQNRLALGKSKDVELKGKIGLTTLHEVIGFADHDNKYQVQMSLNYLLKDEERFGDVFYKKVFEIAPEVEQLFPADMADQKKILTHMLRGIINAMSRPHHLEMGLQSLGKQHINYGVKTEHYPVIKQAFMSTVEEIMQQDCTDAIKEAWNDTLELVTKFMQRAYRSEKSKLSSP